MTEETFRCRFCGQEKPIAERDLQAGKNMAHYDCLMALGFSSLYSEFKNRVVAYDVCRACVDELIAEGEDDEEPGWFTAQFRKARDEGGGSLK